MQRFTDLRVWQRSYALVLSIYKETARLPKDERFGLTSQLRRSTVSVTANIVEGSRRQYPQDYSRFLNVAQASLAETECLLMLRRDLQLLRAEAIAELTTEVEKIARMLDALRKSVLRQIAAVRSSRPLTLDPRPSTGP